MNTKTYRFYDPFAWPSGARVPYDVISAQAIKGMISTSKRPIMCLTVRDTDVLILTKDLDALPAITGRHKIKNDTTSVPVSIYPEIDFKGDKIMVLRYAKDILAALLNILENEGCDLGVLNEVRRENNFQEHKPKLVKAYHRPVVVR